MAPAILNKPLTVADLLAMPEDDGVERWLIDSEMREKPMTKRNRFHSRIMSRLSQLLENWLDLQPVPRGEVLSGEAGVILQRDPDTAVGIDIVYVSPELSSRQTDDTTMIDGIPPLVIEILSPSDTQEEIDEKTDKYLAVGVPHVWIVDPHDETILVHRPVHRPMLYNVDQDVTAEPQLPDFRASVRRVFER